MQFKYRQIIHAIPQYWKETIKHFAGNLNNLYIEDHHLINYNTNYSLEKLYSRKLYHMQLLLKYEKPTCHDYHEKKFDEYDSNWKLISRIPLIVTYETKIRIIHYKLLNNTLYLDKKPFHFGIISQSKCSFCELDDETTQHLFYNEPASIISFRKSCFINFNYTECHLWSYGRFRPELPFSKSFASNIQI